MITPTYNAIKHEEKVIIIDNASINDDSSVDNNLKEQQGFIGVARASPKEKE
jgi:hypothetical protein